MIKRIASALFRRLQRLKRYRVLARRLIGRRVSYRVATIEDAHALSKFYGYDRFSESGDPVERFARLFEYSEGRGDILVASVWREIVGATSISWFPENGSLYQGWWIFGLLVRGLYRRLGIGEKLTRMALEKVIQEGGTRVTLSVFEHNNAAINLYHKMGFQKTVIPGLEEQLEEEVQKGARRRITMSLFFSESKELDQP